MYEKKLASVISLKKGDTLIIDNSPCKVSGVQVSRPGKHGHAKVRLEGVGIFDGKKRIIVMPGHDKIEVPVVEKKNAQVLSISGNMATVMDMQSYETFEMEIPAEFKADVKDNVEILYWEIMGEKMIRQVK